MARQPNWSATRPLIVRDNRMPISTPAAMVPTTRPRAAGSASSLASGMSSWAPTAVSPTSSSAANNTAHVGASAAPARASPEAASTTGMSRRRFNRSPSGTSRKTPTA